MLKLKADVLVTAIFLTAALLFFLVPRLFDGQMDEAGVEILLDGELLERYPLSEDRTVTVPGAEEGYNLVLVSGVSVTLAPFSVPQSAAIAGYNASLVLDIPVMLLVMALLTIPALATGKLRRTQGLALLAIYAAFCAVQFTL